MGAAVSCDCEGNATNLALVELRRRLEGQTKVVQPDPRIDPKVHVTFLEVMDETKRSGDVQLFDFPVKQPRKKEGTLKRDTSFFVKLREGERERERGCSTEKMVGALIETDAR
ncbi:unnamed protein product [Effrenium voratum]|nr:unnamed protein product [Effrenium voratum]